MSLRLRFFAFDADEDPASVATFDLARLDVAEAAVPVEGTPLVFLATLSAADDDEDALVELCQRLEAVTGHDFSSAPRSVVPIDQLASFADAVVGLDHPDPLPTPPPGWLAALREAVGMCRAAYAHLAWELWWDEAGVRDAPDEEVTAASVVPADRVRPAMAAFFGLME